MFVIVLENEGYDVTFGTPFNDPYLATTLPAAGALLTNYYGIGHFSNDNYVALISGQAPNPLNQADCIEFVDFPADRHRGRRRTDLGFGLRLPRLGHHRGQPARPRPT